MKMTKRFKMYKKGKQWVTMAVVAFATTGLANSLMTTSANADDVSSTSATVATTATEKQATDEVESNQADTPTPEATPAVKNGQVTENGATYYYDNGQKKTDYFQKYTDGSISYYGDDGKMYQDKFYQNWGNTYYFKNDGKLMVKDYYKNWGNTYYFGEEGIRYTNKLQQTADKAIYAYDQDGVQYRNRYYYNWGNTYYFGADGKRYTDKFLTHGNGDISYFGQDGVQFKNKFYSNWGHQYYFSNNGNLLKNSAVTMNGVSYKADGDGILTKIDFSEFHPDMRYTIPMQMGSETVANNKYIVLHEVGAESGAQTNAAYLSNLTKRSYNDPNVSAAYSTFVVGDGGKTYQLYTPGMVSWAAGGANKDSVVQIELGRTNNASQFWQDYKTYVNLARSAALQFGIPLTLDAGGNGTPGIKTHNWVTHNVWQGDGHVDPYGYLARFGVTKERLAHDLKYGI